jgi:hypothetical protein
MLPSAFTNWFNTPQNTINVLTILVLAWTALETARARRSSNEANEIAILPLLTIYFEGKFLTEGVKFYIKNLGEGVAYNMQIKPWQCYFGNEGSQWEKLEMRTIVKGTNALPKNEKAELHILTYKDGKREDFQGGLQDFLTFMMAPSTDKPMNGGFINIRIEFKNAYSKTYFTVISTGSGGTNVLQPAVRLNIINRAIWDTRIKWIQIQSNLRYFNKGFKGRKFSYKYIKLVVTGIWYWYQSDYTAPQVNI